MIDMGNDGYVSEVLDHDGVLCTPGARTLQRLPKESKSGSGVDRKPERFKKLCGLGVGVAD